MEGVHMPSIREFRTNLSKIIEDLTEPVEITNRGKVVAVLYLPPAVTTPTATELLDDGFGRGVEPHPLAKPTKTYANAEAQQQAGRDALLNMMRKK
jgi:antitoxin (DNA-binding transcriptional repressor) of toxin-antitoxin stability system